MAHKPTDLTRGQVEFAAAIGVTHENIARELGITTDTLVKHYGDELSLGRDRINTKIASALADKALSGDTTAMIFWLKTRARWQETAKVELSGADGGPMTVKIVYEDSGSPTSETPLSAD